MGLSAIFYFFISHFYAISFDWKYSYKDFNDSYNNFIARLLHAFQYKKAI